VLHAETDDENRRIDALVNKPARGPQPPLSAGEAASETSARLSGCESLPRLLDPSAERAPIFPGVAVRTLLRGDESSGRWSFHEVAVSPGEGLPPHHFEDVDTFWFVVEGQLDLTIGALSRPVGPTAFAYAPGRTTQALRNSGAGEVRLYLAYSPAGPDLAFAQAQRFEDPRTGLQGHGFRFSAGPLQNDARTNQPAERVAAEVRSFDDFLALRQAWADRPPVPRLVDDLTACREVDMSGIRSRILLTGDESSGRAYVRFSTVSPGYVAQPHHQPTEEECFFVVDGELTLTIGSETRAVGPGGFGFAPRNATHGFSNRGGSRTRVLVINSPAGHERGFEALLATQEPERIPELLALHGWRVHAGS
jgi:mannose-6-phosphate isomerase-like protein (cupin superfamily)